jgi:hypothetical protein
MKGQVVGLVVAVALACCVAAGCGGSGSSASAPSSSAPSSSAQNAVEDRKAEVAVRRAVRVAISDYQVFDSYFIVTKQTLRNVNHALRAVAGLTASSTNQRVTISVPSASGTTFTAKGRALRFTYTCSPAGADCRNGHWSGNVSIPKVRKLTVSERAHVRAILLASIGHYAAELDQGVRILGSQPYPNASAGLTAMDNPTSAAARFRDYRQHPNPESDLSFLQAFSKADHYFTAANEPTAISDWRDDMNQAQSDLAQWVTIGVDWQISEASTAKLHAAASKVRTDLAKARADALRAAAS